MQTTNMKSNPVYDETTALPSDMSVLDHISDRGAKLNAYAEMISSRLDNIAGRLFGDAVASDGKSSVQSVPTGMVDHIQMQLDNLYSKMTQIENSVARLERL
jgi:hypothetical protein